MDVQQQVAHAPKAFELSDADKAAPISKTVAESCRHKYEKLFYGFLVAINIILITYTVIILSIELFNRTINLFYELKELNKTPLRTDFGGSDYLIYGIFLFAGAVISLYIAYANARANAVRITQRNFPEVYQFIEDYSHRLGIKTPKAYVVQSSGVLNAFAAYVFKGQWIQINSEVLEVAYREHHDLDALKFIVAHEVSHIYFKHATFPYWFFMCFATQIPILGPTASRAREYSCDRLAQRLTGVDGVESMLVLTVDRHLYKMVDKVDFVNEITHQKGFFIWVVNLFSTHPVMSKRIVALIAGRGSGKLL